MFDGSLFSSLTRNEDGTYKTNTAYTAADYVPMRLKPNTQYVISLRDVNYNLISGNFGIYVDDTYIGSTNNMYKFTSSSSEITNIKIAASGWSTVGTVNRFIQLEENSTATNYTPHKEQVFTFPLGNEKLMLGDYLADDGIHHVKGQGVLDGTETWNLSGYSDDTYLCAFSGKFEGYIKYDSRSLLCNTFVKGFYTDVNTKECIENSGYTVNLKILKSRLNEGTLNGLKTWLAERYSNNMPVIVEYPLAQEIIVPYTSAQQRVYNKIKNAYSYDEMTIITGSSDGNKPFFTVQACKDLNKELNNKVDKVQGKELSSNDFTDVLKEKLEGLENYDDTEIKADISDIQEEQVEQNTDIENLQEENARLKATLPTTTGEGQDITLDKTAEMEFVKPPLPMGNSEQNGEPRPDNEVFITNVTGEVEVTISNENNTESKTLSVSLGNIELCKIGDYQDYLYKNNGKWYKYNAINKLVLNGSENWSVHGSIASWFYWDGITNGFTNNTIRGYALSNYFTQKAYNTVTSLNNGEFAYGQVAGETRKRFVIKDTDYTTVADFKSWLSTHNTIVYYVLATPTDTEITDTTLISQLEEISKTLSYQGQTNISSNTIALFNVEAYQSTKLVLKEMATAIVALGGV